MGGRGRRNKRADQYSWLLDALEEERQRTYHNAHVYWPYEKIPDGMEDLAWEAWNFYVEDTLHDLNHGDCDSHYIEGYIADRYGKVYTWGRSGATCAPSDWIRMGGGSSFNVMNASDLMEGKGRAEGWRLLADMRSWNEYVAVFCGKENILEVIMPAVEDAMEEKKEKARELARMLTI